MMGDKIKKSAIILAGGKGSRMGSSIPKQYLDLDGRRVLSYSVEAFAKVGMDRIVLVCGNGLYEGQTERKICQEILDTYAKANGAETYLADGGEERYNSVYNGLTCLKELNLAGSEAGSNSSQEIVFIHDGARACVTEKIIESCFEDAIKYKACVAAVPVKDTIKVGNKDGFSLHTPDRSTLWQIQTPQTFDFDTILTAYQSMIDDADRGPITDDAMVLEKYTDIKVKLTMADYCNIKITTPEDMSIVRLFVQKK
jgi:2-C-methyl-D-erythritol 4-phosphate cytidylyltransferase